MIDLDTGDDAGTSQAGLTTSNHGKKVFTWVSHMVVFNEIKTEIFETIGRFVFQP